EIYYTAEAPKHAGRIHTCLRDQPDITLSQFVYGPYGLDHVTMGVDNARTVRAKKPASVAAGAPLHLLFRFLAVQAKLGEAGRFHDNRSYSPGAALFDGLWRRGGRRQHDGDVHRLSYIGNAAIRFDSLHLVGLEIDRIEFSRKTVAD